MSDEKQSVELKSDDVEDILGRMPTWITRNGIFLLCLVILFMLLGSWFYKIPELRIAEISVTSLQPPAAIAARADGKIDMLLVEDNAKVISGQVLAVIENSADYEDIVSLQILLEKIYSPSGDITQLDLPVNGNAELGTVQPYYSSFFRSYRDYIEFLRLDYHSRKIELLQKEFQQLEVYEASILARSYSLKEEYELAVKQYGRDSLLYIQGVNSESDYEASRSEMLNKRDSWQEMLTMDAENKIRIAQIDAQILELELKKQEQITSLSTSLEESINSLKASLALWEQEYLIISPLAGQVTFNSFWSENQNVKIGESVMTIIPADEGNLIGKIKLPLQGAGEVKVNQPVNIKFENYPYLKYGMVKGVVSNVSMVPENNFYTVEVDLPDGLVTYYGVEIGFNQNMTGEAEILTDNMRLIQRIFNPIKNSVKRQRSM